MTIKEIIKRMDDREFSLFLGNYCQTKYSNFMMNNGYRVLKDILMEDEETLIEIIKGSSLKYLLI